jgi:hypothetical protein
MAMAFGSAHGQDGDALAAAIPQFLRAAEEGRALDPGGRPYSAAAVRSLGRTLAHVEAALADVELVHVVHADSVALEALAWQVIDRSDLAPDRIPAVVDALRRVAAAAAPTPAPARAPSDPVKDPPSRPQSRTPTFTMLALGSQVGLWIERIVVVAFVLTAIGLALALV